MYGKNMLPVKTRGVKSRMKTRLIIEYCKYREVLFMVIKSEGYLIYNGYGKSILY